MEKKQPIDWEAIERDYRSGIGSLSEIGARYGVSKGRISQIATRDGWDRDLSAKIQAKAEAKLNDSLVNAELNAKRLVTDRERVEAGAAAITEMVLAHRKDTAALRQLVNAYREELASCGDDLKARAGILKMLSDTQKTLIGIERQAFGISDDPEQNKPPEAKAVSEMEAARRVAFLLSCGMREKSAHQGNSVANSNAGNSNTAGS